MTAFKNGNKVSISAKENTTTSERLGTIVVTATANTRLSYTIMVTQNSASPYILVDGSSEVEHTFPGSFDALKSGIDYKQTFKVKSNIQWVLGGKPEWLNVSPNNGNGDVDITIYPTSENNADKSREATLTLLGADGTSVYIKIIQLGGKPQCYVQPKNLVALYDRMCWEYSATTNVNTFQWILLQESEYRRMTDREIQSEIQLKPELKFVDDYISFAGYDSHDNRITSGSTYYQITIAYDAAGKGGELQKTVVKTPLYFNEDQDAWVSFENVYSNESTGFWFDAIKEGYCNTYHLIYGIKDEVFNSVIAAFEINYYLKNKTKHWVAKDWNMEIATDYPNNHTFTYSTPYLPYYPICFAYGWGVFKDGTLSSDLVGFQWDTSQSESMRKMIRKQAPLKNASLSRSKVLVPAK